MEKEKDKDKAELFIENLEDYVRELVVNFSRPEIESDRSRDLVEEGETFN